MYKVIFIFLLGFQISLSQTSTELKEIKEQLELRKVQLLSELNVVEKQIDSLDHEIGTIEIFESTYKTTVKKKGKALCWSYRVRKSAG